MNGNPCIWLLDDDVEFSDLICNSFIGLGWRCKHLMDSHELLRALKTTKPDLLLLDEVLVNERGTDLLSHAKQRNLLSFPVLMMSALGSPIDRVTGLAAGADDYLIKPFLFQELLIRIERLLKHVTIKSSKTEPTCFNYIINGVFLDISQQALILSSGKKHLLSRGELTILRILCANAGNIVAREVLLEAGQSSVDFQTTRTIDVRISRLRKILALMPVEPIVIETIRGRGYRIKATIQQCTDLSNLFEEKEDQC
jgi:DNA-binding response OmpR family regulator